MEPLCFCGLYFEEHQILTMKSQEKFPSCIYRRRGGAILVKYAQSLFYNEDPLSREKTTRALSQSLGEKDILLTLAPTTLPAHLKGEDFKKQTNKTSCAGHRPKGQAHYKNEIQLEDYRMLPSSSIPYHHTNRAPADYR